MFKPPINQRIIRAMLLGELCIVMGVLALSLSSFQPLQSPIIKTPAATPLSYEESELRRIPHQGTHYPLILFSVPAQDYRADTAIRFHYRIPETPLPTYLQFEHDGTFEDVALAFHPVLHELEWPSIQEGRFRLYQRTDTYDTIQEFLSSSPTPHRFAADRVASRHFKLPEMDLIDLDNLISDESVDNILTSYEPPRRDGWWRIFDQSFDLSNLQVNSHNELVGRLSSTDDTRKYETPVYIGDFHVDYKKMRY